MEPVRSAPLGTRAVQRTSSVALSPGRIGSGNVTDITVSSSALPSSGAMKCFVAVRSRPGGAGEEVVAFVVVETSDTELTSMLESWSDADNGLPVRARSRRNVERVVFHAFQYRWNWSSLVGLTVEFRHWIRSDPESVRLCASSVASIV